MDKPFCRGDYEQAVSQPGKFEGEQPYIPYLWESVMNGFGFDENEDGSVSVEVAVLDEQRFPELRGKQSIRMREREDGFVVEC